MNNDTIFTLFYCKNKKYVRGEGGRRRGKTGILLFHPINHRVIRTSAHQSYKTRRIGFKFYAVAPCQVSAIC
ncbi:hypothetical protein [Fowlpox virus]|nr:hypothetical protein [Fowlpox virus]UQT20746.1 hypothetical protein [Fowlpox virus]